MAHSFNAVVKLQELQFQLLRLLIHNYFEVQSSVEDFVCLQALLCEFPLCQNRAHINVRTPVSQVFKIYSDPQ